MVKTVLGEIKGNVENMLSKSRGDYAYTILDVAGDYDLDAIKNTEGVIRVRAIA